MEKPITVLRKRIAAVLIAVASPLAISVARFERNPQSCGMMTVQGSRKRPLSG